MIWWLAFRLSLSFRLGISTILLLLFLLLDLCYFEIKNSSSFRLDYHSSPSLLTFECYSLMSTCLFFFIFLLGFDFGYIFMFSFSDFLRFLLRFFLFESLFGFFTDLGCFGLCLSLSVVIYETIYRVVLEL